MNSIFQISLALAVRFGLSCAIGSFISETDTPEWAHLAVDR